MQTALPADTDTVPGFWDRNEPVPRTDLGQISRLRFLTTVDFPPFNFLDTRQKLSGFNVDLVRRICAELEISAKCEIQALPFVELVPALEARQGEAIIAGLTPMPESRSRLAFSRSYLRLPARFVTNRLAAGTFTGTPQDIAKVRVGVLARSAHERMFRAYFPTGQVVIYDREEWMLEDLKSGNVDALFADAMRMSFWIGGTASDGCCAFAGGPYFADDYLGTGMSIAVANTRPELVRAINFALKTLEEKGVISELYLRYFPVGFY